jgi:NAD(P)H-hydrate epimerase
MRAGAGYVRLGVPGLAAAAIPPGEHVGRSMPAAGWDEVVLADIDRYRALVVGPGLGRDEESLAAVRRLVARAPVPVVVDGDGLVALAGNGADAVRTRSEATVLTPHDGEYAVLTGAAPGPDRIAAARRPACDLGVTVLLKGPTTVVTSPAAQVLLSVSDDARLATAGTGDVLSGVVGAFLAAGMDGPRAGAAGARVHADAARLGSSPGLVAGDLADLLPAALNPRPKA